MTLGKMRKLVIAMAALAICIVAFENDANAFFGRKGCCKANDCCGIGGLFRCNKCECEECKDCGKCEKSDDCCEAKSDCGCRRLFRRHRRCCSDGAPSTDAKSDAPEKAEAGA